MLAAHDFLKLGDEHLNELDPGVAWHVSIGQDGNIDVTQRGWLWVVSRIPFEAEQALAYYPLAVGSHIDPMPCPDDLKAILNNLSVRNFLGEVEPERSRVEFVG